MIVPDPNMFGGSVYVCKNLGDPWKEYKTNKMPLGKINIRSQSSRANESATNSNYRGAGLAEMAFSIENKKINKCNGELSLHVLDIIQSTMKNQLIHTLLLFVNLSLFAQIDPKGIDIARDTYGVPHIFAKTDAEVAYGLAWAHAEDDFTTIQQSYLAGKQLTQ